MYVLIFSKFYMKIALKTVEIHHFSPAQTVRNNFDAFVCLFAPPSLLPAFPSLCGLRVVTGIQFSRSNGRMEAA